VAKTLLGVIFFMKRIENICVFLAGGTVYGIIEMIWRGYTHWSMVLAGGAAFILIHLLNGRFRTHSIAMRCFIGAVVITLVELISGIILNLWLDMNVWDYSEMRWNLLGQICPAFSAMWFLLCIPAFYLSGVMRMFFDVISKKERSA